MSSKKKRIQKIKKKIKKFHSRYTAMSKLIGIVIGIALLVIIAYTMYEMHVQNNLDSLPQLIISAFSIGSVYVGFYLTMAKWEHLETEKTKRQKELLQLKKTLNIFTEEELAQEQMDNLANEIQDCDSKQEDTLSKNDTENI